MVVAWRVVKARYAAHAFSGEGAERVDGRWHSAGSLVVYASANRALAMLEVLATFSGSDRATLPACVLISATFPERRVETIAPDRLPPAWDIPGGSPAARAFGRQWLVEARSVALRVPSVLVPGEHNILLNPSHPQFSEVLIGEPRPFLRDQRLRVPPG